MSTFNVQNPNNGKTEEEFNRINDSDRDAILDRAKEAFASWRQTPIEQRAKVLSKTAQLYRDRQDELAEYIGREMGKPTAQAKDEIQTTWEIYDWYAEHAHELLADKPLAAQGALHTYVRKDPLGVLLGVMPWNFPYYQVVRWAAPNLLLGNTLVLKHASICPLSSQACQDLLEEAGLPQGVFQNIYASGSQMEAFVADPRVSGVSLTGSEEAGAAVAKTAGEHYKKSLLELGGNDPFIVLDDENLDWVLEQYVALRMFNAGQSCNAPKRLIVMEDFYDRALESLTEKIQAVKPGPFDDDSADMGPLSSIGARDDVVERIAEGAKKGLARVAVGGSAVDRDGAYMEATLLTDVDPESDLGCNEIFGPVACLYKASDVEHALEIANSSDYGLSGSVWGADLEKAHEVAARLEVGMSYVNSHAETAAGLPFGGVGRSGYGRELAEWGVGEFVNDHLIRVNAQG